MCRRDWAFWASGCTNGSDDRYTSMTERLEVLSIEDLRPLLDQSKVIERVRQALIRQAMGEVQSPLPGQLVFEHPRGDCHIKFGHVAGSDRFAIKVATGF